MNWRSASVMALLMPPGRPATGWMGRPPMILITSWFCLRVLITRRPASLPAAAITPRRLRWAAGASGPTTKSGPPSA